MVRRQKGKKFINHNMIDTSYIVKSNRKIETIFSNNFFQKLIAKWRAFHAHEGYTDAYRNPQNNYSHRLDRTILLK